MSETSFMIFMKTYEEVTPNQKGLAILGNTCFFI